MGKKVISVRLSEERLEQLDEACKQLGLNRSEAIDAALRLLPEIISGSAEYSYKPSWLGKDDEKVKDGEA